MTHNDLERFKSKRSGNGVSPLVKTIEFPQPDTRSKSKRFEVEWIKLPIHWVKALRRARGIKTYELALIILTELFKRQRFGVLEVTLSTEVTGMNRETKMRAAKDLARLKLIILLPDGKRALRVIPQLSIKSKK
jgi:hypothetical protein